MKWRQTPTQSVRSLLGLGMLCALLLAGCMPKLPPPKPYALFPPQRPMDQGDYATFRTTNLLVIDHCDTKPGCEVALFNLGFVYAYPDSPFYNPTEALRYFDSLLKKYPQTHWAAQGKVWVALLKEQQAFLPPSGLGTREDYQRFRSTNMQIVERCDHTLRCEVALFNLGFVHAYPASPYYSPAQALHYFSTLVKDYPQTSWAAQGDIWLTLLKEQYVLEEKQRQLQADLQAKEQAIRSQETAIRSKENAMRTQETELRTKEATIRTLQEQKDATIRTLQEQKDATIRTLQEQMERARDIDVEIDKKERALLR